MAIAWSVVSGAPTAAALLPEAAAICLPADALRGAEVVLLDQHGGRGATPSFELAGPRHPTHVVAVEGDKTGKPLVLVVSAYEPTIWDVSAIAPSRLRAVVAYGFYPPAVIGNSPGTLVRFGRLGSAAEWRGSAGCGPINLAFSGTGHAAIYSDQVSRVFGVRPSRYFGGYDPAAFHVDAAKSVSMKPSIGIDETPTLPETVGYVPVSSERREAGWQARSRSIQTSLRWGSDDEPIIFPSEIRISQTVRGRTSSQSAARVRVQPPTEHRTDGLDYLLGLLSVGALCAFALAWYRNSPARSGGKAKRPDDAVPTSFDHVAGWAGSLQSLISTCAEPGSRSMFEQFADEVESTQRMTLDSDLESEAATLIERDASLLIATTQRALRSSADPQSVERSAREAIERLIGHLRRLRDEQRRRDTDALGTAQGFLRARYPTPDDPFALR